MKLSKSKEYCGETKWGESLELVLSKMCFLEYAYEESKINH